MPSIPVPAVGQPTFQSWAKAVADRLNALPSAVIRFSGTTDAAGFVNVPAAAFGLATVTRAVVSNVGQTATPAAATLIVSLAEATGPVVAMRFVSLFNVYPADAQWGYVGAGTAVVVDAMGWGTYAATAQEEEAIQAAQAELVAAGTLQLPGEWSQVLDQSPGTAP